MQKYVFFVYFVMSSLQFEEVLLYLCPIYQRLWKPFTGHINIW